MEKQQIVVSLTSFPAAIPFAVAAIRSILDGSVLPDRVVLYLTTSQFSAQVPPELQELANRNPLFDVRFYDENIRSYTKLIPALRDFPQAVIITIDDDVLYHRDMIKQLLRRHAKYPEAIVGHRIRHIKPGASYRMWKCYKRFSVFTRSLKPGFRNLQTGVGGVLYPPGSLCPQMLNSELFMGIAPTVDDIWFWAAAVAQGTKIAPIPFGFWRQPDLRKPAEVSLKSTNVFSGVDVNRAVFENILEKYPIIKQRFEA